MPRRVWLERAGGALSCLDLPAERGEAVRTLAAPLQVTSRASEFGLHRHGCHAELSDACSVQVCFSHHSPSRVLSALVLRNEQNEVLAKDMDVLGVKAWDSVISSLPYCLCSRT